MKATRTSRNEDVSGAWWCKGGLSAAESLCLSGARVCGFEVHVQVSDMIANAHKRTKHSTKQYKTKR